MARPARSTPVLGRTARLPKADPEAAPALSQLLLDDVRALGLKLDDMRRERADPSASVDLGAMRAEIEAMSRSLADLAPRNAVVALEGAIRDLVQRVEMLRQSGHGEFDARSARGDGRRIPRGLKSA